MPARFPKQPVEGFGSRRWFLVSLIAAWLVTAGATADLGGTGTWSRWIEAEDYAEQQGAQAPFFEMPETASGGRIVNNDWGRRPGDFLRWHIEVPHECPTLYVTLRFCRAIAPPAELLARIGDRERIVRFPGTGGWGFRSEDWQYAELRFERVPAGLHELTLQALSAGANLNTDGFYLSDAPPAVPGRRIVLEDETERRALRQRRSEELLHQVRQLPPIAYVVQHRLGNPDGMVRYHAWPGIVNHGGCRIERLDPSRPELPPQILWQDPEGAIFDLNVSYDARTLFFTHRRQGEENWRIWEMGVDGSAARQITSGPYTDFGPEELPDGRLIFCSTRIRSFNICAQTLSTALFSARRDGSDIRQVTVNTLNDYSPHVLPNGQILFTRWEYVDRDVKWRQSLWTVNPDGTNLQLFFGNTVRNPAVIWQARPIPGTDRVAATFAPHHGWPLGAIGTVTRQYGTETPAGIGYDWITREYPEIWDDARLTEWAYRDPFPLDDGRMLVSYGGGLNADTEKRFRILLLDPADFQSLVHEDPQLSCIYPVPLVPRPRPPVLAPRVEPSGQMEGVFLLTDIYQGLGTAVQPGEIKALRILEQPAKFPVNESSPRAFEMAPVMGRRCYYRKRCLGVVPVEIDGSAHFRVPALRELYFQALDAEGRAVQSMGSAVNLAPGEQQSCLGCHENRRQPPLHHTGVPLAARRAPIEPRPYPWQTRPEIAFPEVVQPVLDRHCAECHGGPRPADRLDLSGDLTRFFSMAYDNIWDRQLLWSVQLTANDGQVIPPKAAWSFASKLPEYLSPQHHDVQLSPEEKERIYLWLDTNGNYYGTHQRTRPGTIGGRDTWTGPWFDQRLVPLFQENCSQCHGALDKHQTMGNTKMAWINLTHPENSRLLTAHLAESAGGWELTAQPDDPPAPRWSDREHPLYQAMLEAIREGRDDLLANPRIDMPGAVARRGHNDWGSFPGTVGADAPIPDKYLPDETP